MIDTKRNDPAPMVVRLRQVVDLYEDRTEAAKASGVSVQQVARYLRGASDPNFAAVAGLAADRNVSLDWIYSGSGEMLTTRRGEASLDEDLLGAVIEVVENVLKERNLELTFDKKAILISNCYVISISAGGYNHRLPKAMVVKLVELAS